MSEQKEIVKDHGLEVLRKAGMIPDLSSPQLYALRTKIIDALEGSFKPSGLNEGGKITEVSINSSIWTELPSTALTNRNAICIQNSSGVEIKLNYDNTVETYTGIAMQTGSERYYDISDQIKLYAKSTSGTVTIVIEEIA